MSSTYANLGKSKQIELIGTLKRASKLTWEQLASKLGVNRSMVFQYAAASSAIPIEKLETLHKLAGTRFDSRIPTIEIRNKPRLARISRFNEDFAEFLGFLAGDGCLTSKYMIIITCNAKSDKKYVNEIVRKKFVKLFGLEPTVFANPSVIACRLYSKQVFEFIHSRFDFPIGEKKGRLRIPKIIATNRDYARAFIRGLFDTDGGFHRHNSKSAKIEITSFSEGFLKEVYEVLKKMNFHPFLMKNSVQINSKDGVRKFFGLIKPHNPKHLYKFQQFLQTGQVPRHKDIDYQKLEYFKTTSL